ncbi:MAG: SLBB domain-containing protein [Myxococcales bacterium]|nr:SLBB domain-containing protein [Myxococcales bacterium]
MSRPRSSPDVLEHLRSQGGLKSGTSETVARQTHVPAATVFGVGSFYHLLADTDTHVRVCTGLSCSLGGADALLTSLAASGVSAAPCSCLAMCDQPAAALVFRRTVPRATVDDITMALNTPDTPTRPSTICLGTIGPEKLDPCRSVFRLSEQQEPLGTWFERAKSIGAKPILDLITDSGLQGRGGAGFPAGVKWRAVAAETSPQKYVVLNADEGEPGTFKDRELLIRRPDLVIEGLAIAAWVTGATDVYCYLRGEFEHPWAAVEHLTRQAEATSVYGNIRFHLHAGDGAYICGEETALLEALEGKRGMPRLKPPFPTTSGLFKKPTLIHNVETIACVPALIQFGAQWFRDLGRTQPGTKLYCISGHVHAPGVYELPLGITLDELIDTAGGPIGTPKAFSPGGASSGFLPMRFSHLPLDFKHLADIGSMLGSAGVVVLNTEASIVSATLDQLRFFEAESCGQCAPCRIGTRWLHTALRSNQDKPGSFSRSTAEDIVWQMKEGSICGLGQAAPLPLESALHYFPEEFGHD